MKKWICIIVMCGFLTGCGIQPETNSTLEPSEAVTETNPTESETEETLPELSDEIPTNAVTKVTCREYRDNELRSTRIRYDNSQGDIVLYCIYDETGELFSSSSTAYQYDENDNVIYECHIDDSGQEEYFFEYDSHHNLIRTTEIDETHKYISESTYDQYGNEMTLHTVLYDTSSEDGEPQITYEIAEDYSDCEYDENGHILAFRTYSQKSGKLLATETNTYNESGQLVFTEYISGTHDPDDENDTYGWNYRYEYDENGNKILDEKTVFSAPDVISSQYTDLWQYDERNRMICYEKQRDGNVVRIDYEYENL